jgi:heme/copper-type cytochrome/quinol oxidase subunit 2
MQKREMERTQLMIALYLGVGITIFLIVIGVVVECLRKRYYEEQDESVTSIDSNDDIQ